MGSKKGISLPVETVIIIIIALVVLILILLFTTGKWGALVNSFSGLETEAVEGAKDYAFG